VGAALVVARDDGLYLVRDDAPVRRFGERSAAAGRPARTALGEGHDPPEELVTALEGLPASVSIRVCGEAAHRALSGRLTRSIRPGDVHDWHIALGAVPPADPATERASLLERAREELDAELRSPVEVLISLAREEERAGRAVGREQRAAEQFVAVPGTALAEHAVAWAKTRELLVAHHRELGRRLEAEAWRTVPNLSAVVGPRTAARLVAAAGGLLPLARVTAARLQLLGSRRRPNPERGPRFGAIYLADGLDTVPTDRRGAYARSLAALAVVAARADAFTRSDLSGVLRRRRDVRLEQLRRRRR
jgi:snoRNA binding domain, fibrillarin